MKHLLQRARLLLTVVVPVVAPKEKVVAAPPMLRLVAVELKRLAVVCDVVTEPPLTATLPACCKVTISSDGEFGSTGSRSSKDIFIFGLVKDSSSFAGSTKAEWV